MHYSLNQLKIFVKVVEKESITKAAELLHLSQPAVSIQIKNLQDQFDVPLLEHIGRRIYITDFGHEIARSAQKILEQMEQMESKKMAYQGYLAGKLTISVVSTGKYVMPYFLSGFIRNYPGIQLKLDVTNKQQVIESLEKNQVDFSLVSIIPKNLALEKEMLMKNELLLVGPGNSDNFTKISSLKDLEKVPLIFREAGSATREAMENFIKSKNIEVNNRLELTSNEAVKQAVIAGLGLSIMPLIGIRSELQHGKLKIHHIKGLPIFTNWNIVWLENKNFSPAAEAYLNFIREKKEEIIKAFFS
ncbi:MAG: LysR family transcriptional regulator [Vicingaceae bacterium]